MHIRGEKLFKWRYVCAALALFNLYGCGVLDPTDYGVGTRYFTITFDGNGNTSGSAPASIARVAEGSTITLPGQGNLARTNYTFGWWRTTGRYSSETADYYPGDSYSVKRSLTFYAKWLPIYTVQFNGNGVTNGVPTAVQADSGKSITLPAALTRSGYNFSGWSTIGSVNYPANSSYTVTNNITLYAKWMTSASVISGTFTDTRNSQTYRTVKIGNQTWMAENLNYSIGNSWCYGGSTDSCSKYGRLYDWTAANTACPSGWHLPTREEWVELAISAGGIGTYGTNGAAGMVLKSKSGWYNNGNGTDDFQFSALPGGSRSSNGYFNNAGNSGIWWTAAEYDGSNAYYRGMNYYYDYVYESNGIKGNAYSVRCLQN